MRGSVPRVCDGATRAPQGTVCVCLYQESWMPQLPWRPPAAVSPPEGAPRRVSLWGPARRPPAPALGFPGVTWFS